MEYPFYIFGSRSSLDYDIVLFPLNLGTVKENHDFCEQQAKQVADFFHVQQLPAKKINANAALIKNGIITSVYKGTPDELNNAVLTTYPLHKQFYPLLIERPVERNWQLKMIRACRTILSFYSRTAIRAEIKQALQGDLDKKIQALNTLNLAQWTELQKNDSQDCWKTISFQLGQAMGLLDGIELYTKEDIIRQTPLLDVFLQRQTTLKDLPILNTFKQQFVDRLQNVRPLFTQLTEDTTGN